jgi:hypothetical protein
VKATGEAGVAAKEGDVKMKRWRRSRRRKRSKGEAGEGTKECEGGTRRGGRNH